MYPFEREKRKKKALKGLIERNEDGIEKRGKFGYNTNKIVSDSFPILRARSYIGNKSRLSR